MDANDDLAYARWPGVPQVHKLRPGPKEPPKQVEKEDTAKQQDTAKAKRPRRKKTTRKRKKK